MTERRKKILLVGGFVASVFGFAFALYFMFFKAPAPPATVEDVDTPAIGSLPSSLEAQVRELLEQEGLAPEDVGLQEADTVARGGITQTTELTSTAVYNTVISENGDSMNYYNSGDGRFYTIDEDGNVTPLSDKQFPEAESVVWNKDSEKAVIEFPDGSNVIYDFSAEKQVTLPSHWEDFDFSPVQDEIIAKSLALDPNNRYLVVSSDDGSRVQSIQALGENESKVDVNWSPNDQVVAFAATAKATSGGLNRTVIYPVGKNKENFKGLVVEGLNFDSLWSPDGKLLMYSVTGSYSNDKPLLWAVKATSSSMGDDRRSLGLNTWVDKCTWTSASIAYCAVPLDLPPNAGLGRALYEKEPDALYKINLATGAVTLVAIPEGDTSMNNLYITDDDSKLYFSNAYGQLEMMRLK